MGDDLCQLILELRVGQRHGFGARFGFSQLIFVVAHQFPPRSHGLV